MISSPFQPVAVLPSCRLQLPHWKRRCYRRCVPTPKPGPWTLPRLRGSTCASPTEAQLQPSSAGPLLRAPRKPSLAGSWQAKVSTASARPLPTRAPSSRLKKGFLPRVPLPSPARTQSKTFQWPSAMLSSRPKETSPRPRALPRPRPRPRPHLRSSALTESPQASAVRQLQQTLTALLDELEEGGCTAGRATRPWLQYSNARAGPLRPFP